MMMLVLVVAFALVCLAMLGLVLVLSAEQTTRRQSRVEHHVAGSEVR